MTSTPSAFSSLATGDGAKGEENKKQASGSSPVTYDPPPASWFFGRGVHHENATANNQAGVQSRPEENHLSGSPSSNHYKDPLSPNDSNHRTMNHQPNSNPEWGMVSDNEEEDEHEGFNFIAVSNSLLMAGRSFEHVPENDPKEDASEHSSSDKQRGVLIMDGVSSISSGDGAPAATGGITTNNNSNSELTIPGSDSLPSDIGTICHEEEEPLFGEGSHPDAKSEGSHSQKVGKSYPPLVHRFLKNLQRNRRLRLVSDASDESGGIRSGFSVVRDEDLSVAWSVETMEDRFFRSPFRFLLRRRTLSIMLVAFLMGSGLACYSFVSSQRKQREAWEQRLLKEKEATARLLAEKESLRLEMEILLEEAAVATARAESLAKEQERLLLEREEAERAEKEVLRKQEEMEAKKRRRQQPWRSDSNLDEDFDWFFDDSNEECSGRSDNGPSSITLADNCWFKAKADINLGSCGSDTKNFFQGIWSGFFKDWDHFFDDPTSKRAMEPYATSGDQESRGAKESEEFGNDYNQIGNGKDDREGGYDDQGRYYEYHDDTYYPPQDPFQDLFSVIHSAGQSFVHKLSKLMNDEVETTQNAAREMEETVLRRYTEASNSVTSAMEIAKEDMRELSKEALSALRTAVQKSNSKHQRQKSGNQEGESPNHNSSDSPTTDAGEEGTNPAQEVTPQGLFDAATAVTLLSKVWEENAKALSVSGKGSEE